MNPGAIWLISRYLPRGICFPAVFAPRGSWHGVDKCPTQKSKLYNNSIKFRKIRNNSFKFEIIPSNSKKFEKIPKNSKKFQKIPKNSKKFQKNPKNSKKFQKISKKVLKKFQKIRKIWKIRNFLILICNLAWLDYIYAKLSVSTLIKCC